MIKNFKSLSLAAALVLSPFAASALSFGGDVQGGDTYSFTDGQKSFVAVAIGDEAAGSFSFDVTNNAATTWTYTFGVPFLNNSLPGGLFFFGPNANGQSIVGENGIFSLALAAGETLTLTVAHDALVRGDTLGARMSAVPLPAGLVLLLSALGMTAVAHRRKTMAV